ncbi:acyltransferase family protein [Pseudomonas oryzihabitans]|uniref:acyltransferase family protein n=1 Tax=Pseudomonas oryzihabitans TaxID=47885 RepID=UPI00111DA842|nr:acyltransferase [Pseudomonas psychrotolerans]QDD89926.1 hypothetical protein CCZ28_13235 [Pseudomonas psychrotolerans]
MLHSIQYLRAAAALMVVLHHIAIKGQQYGSDAFSFLTVGQFGVDLFFIISGFIMCHTTHGKNLSFGRFMLARVQRILPLYWLFTAVALLLWLSFPNMVNAGGGETSIWASWLLAPNGMRYLVDNGWTLRYEFLFYLIFGLSLMLTKGKRQLLVASVLLLLALTGLLVKPENSWLQFLLDPLLLEFLMGIAVFHLWRSGHLGRWPLSLLGLVGLVALIYQNDQGLVETPLGRVFSGGLPMMLICLSVVGAEDRLSGWRNMFKPLERLGDSSYSLYLSHVFVLSPLARVAQKVGILGGWSFGGLLLVGALLVGWLCYAWVERPLNAWAKQWGGGVLHRSARSV